MPHMYSLYYTIKTTQRDRICNLKGNINIFLISKRFWCYRKETRKPAVILRTPKPHQDHLMPNQIKKPEHDRKRDSVSAVIYLSKPVGLPPLAGCPYPRFKDRLFGLHAGGVYPCTHRLPGALVSVALYGYSKPGGFLWPSSGRPAPACAGRLTTPSARRRPVCVSRLSSTARHQSARQRLPAILRLYSVGTYKIINHLGILRKCKLCHGGDRNLPPLNSPAAGYNLRPALQ